MSFIEKVLVQNFQKHTKTILKLDKGLNVIYGESDAGKSSIIRALKWVITNKPSGDYFRKHDTAKTSVTIKKDDNIIRRRKSDNKNEYKVNDENPHKATRSSVPEDIASKLNLSEVNIQSQIDTYFLVQQSPGQRSKILNEVAGLEIMDKTIGLTNTEIREINSQLKLKERSLTDTKVLVKNLSWVNGADIKLQELESLKEKINVFSKKSERIEEIIYTLNKLEKKKDQLLSDGFIEGLEKLILLGNKINKRSTRSEKISNIVKRIAAFKKENAEIVMIDTQELEKMLISINSLENRSHRVQTLITALISKKHDRIRVKKEISEAESKITGLLKKFGICPLCKNKIK